MASTFNSSKNTSRAILVIVGILVLSALGYFATKYFSEKESNKQKEVKIDKLSNEIIDLEEKLLTFELSQEDKELELADKNDQLNRKNDELDRMYTEISQYKKENKANLAKIKQMETRLTDLQSLIARYQATIADYQKKYAKLEAVKDSIAANEGKLKEQNQNLMDQAATAKREKQEIEVLASKLTASDLRYFNVRKNGREDEGTEFARRKMNAVKVCFIISENLFAPSGKREVYMVYENPGDASQNLNYDAGISGTFMYEGAKKEYSAKTSFVFKRLAQEVCITFSPDPALKSRDQFQKGPQYISLYTTDNLIGQGNFIIK
ncbi:MAG: hypothetical protein AAF587_42195 [Bacteroidota bacterium]